MFVADFLGVSNLMDAEVVTGDEQAAARSGSATSPCAPAAATSAPAERVKIVARPERLTLLPFDAGETRQLRCPGMVERTVYVGATLQVDRAACHRRADPGSIANTGAAADYRQGVAVRVQVPPDALRVLAPPAGVSMARSEEAPPAEALAAGGA